MTDLRPSAMRSRLLPILRTCLLPRLVSGVALALQFGCAAAFFATPLPTQAASTDSAAAPKILAFAPSAQLNYVGNGLERGFLRYTGSGVLQWTRDNKRYDARLEISAWGFRVRTWTSTGALGSQGLLPARFAETPRGPELLTRFDRELNRISFSSGDGDLPLLAGAQDKLSALLQLSAIVGADPLRYSNGGASIRFQAADAHRAELWDFQVSAQEALDLPDGSITAIKLTKEANPQYDQKIEVWLAAAAAYLPVRIRITEAGGNFVDLLWQKTQKPD